MQDQTQQTAYLSALGAAQADLDQVCEAIAQLRIRKEQVEKVAQALGLLFDASRQGAETTPSFASATPSPSQPSTAPLPSYASAVPAQAPQAKAVFELGGNGFSPAPSIVEPRRPIRPGSRVDSDALSNSINRALGLAASA